MIKSLSLLLIILIQSLFINLPKAYAATSPDLGDAASFAVLAGSGITGVPTSVITGDVGLSPAAGSNIVGLTTAEVSGTIFAVDSSGPEGTTGNDPTLLTSAKNDLITAYDDLAAVPNATCNNTFDATIDTGLGAVDLAGKTLPPDVYCADSFALSGTLTLDDTGAAGGVWIFRAATTIISSSGVGAEVVFLNNLASSCNVWWRAETSATIGVTSDFIGNVLALASITMNTGATLQGRALARNGAVTLESNTINQSCTATIVRASSSASTTTSSSTSPGAAVCPPLNYVSPIIIESSRVDPDSVFISWGPYSGIDTFSVRYGLTNGDWLYNTTVTGFSTTINDLPLNQPIWIQVAASDNCSIGTYGEAKLVGGPRLPNAGLGSSQNTLSWHIPAGLLMVSSFLLKLIHL